MDDTFSRDLITMLPRLRRFAVALTGSRQEANELVQDTCERAIKASASWSPGTRLDAWLFRILRNLWIDALRRQRHRGWAEPLDLHTEIADPAAGGERQLDARMALQKVRAAIACLPDDQREVLVMVCIEELSYRETAGVLDVPIGTVMSRLSRARRRVAELIGDSGCERRTSAER